MSASCLRLNSIDFGWHLQAFPLISIHKTEIDAVQICSSWKTEPSLLDLTNRHLCLSLTSSTCAAMVPFLNFSVYRSGLLWSASAAHVPVPWNNEEQGSSPLQNYPILKNKSRHKQCFTIGRELSAEVLWPVAHANRSGTECHYW